MIRPLARWTAAAVLVGVALGCDAKKKSTAPDTAPPAPGGANAPTAGNTPPGKPPAGRSNTLYTADGAHGPVGGPPGGVVGGGAGGGGVEVKACKFDGVESALAAARGKVVLVDCWATWCPPCVASFPKLVEKHEKYSGKGLAVISLSLDEPGDEPAVLAFLKKNNATFTNLHLTMDQAADQSLKSKFAYRNAIPHAVLFDKSGRRVWAGHPMTPDLEKKIEAELAR
jgi:thiol-disulfide isomerase/thioredoxin